MNLADLQSLKLADQHHRFLKLSFPKGDGPDVEFLLIQELHATESIGRDFEFVVHLICSDGNLEYKQLIGRMMTVALHREDGSRRFFNGYLFSLSLVRVDGGVAYYMAVLRPWMAFLGLRRDNYLFHGKTLYEQTSEIFADYPQSDWQWRVACEDPEMTDACQFQESDRLCQERPPGLHAAQADAVIRDPLLRRQHRTQPLGDPHRCDRYA